MVKLYSWGESRMYSPSLFSFPPPPFYPITPPPSFSFHLTVGPSSFFSLGRKQTYPQDQSNHSTRAFYFVRRSDSCSFVDFLTSLYADFPSSTGSLDRFKRVVTVQESLCEQQPNTDRNRPKSSVHDEIPF